jgi:hypothetical protein
LVGGSGHLVVAAQGGEVAGHLDQVVVVGGVVLEAAQPHRQGAFVLLGMRPGVAACQVFGDPGVDQDPRLGSEQGEVGKPVDVFPQRAQGLRPSGVVGVCEGAGEVV